jgi:hypothetical protein
MACIKQIYAVTATCQNPMRRLLVKFWYDSAKPKWYAGGMEEVPKGFLWESTQLGGSRVHEKGLEGLEKFWEGEYEVGETDASGEED